MHHIINRLASHIGETKYIGKTALHNPEVKSKQSRKNHLPGLYTFKTRFKANFGQIWILENQVPGLLEASNFV